MTGIIDVGGGMRDIYGSGVLDYCLDNKIYFDYILGVSAGTANLFTYAAGQRGRTKRFYENYAFRKEYMSFSNLLKGKNYLDLDYIYSSLSNEGGEDPFDFDALEKYEGDAYIACTDAETGEQIYFDKKIVQKNNLTAFKASCALPLVCKKYSVGGIPCFDGGISNPVPIEKAFEDGCDKVVVILTLPSGYIKQPGKIRHAFALIKKKYPGISKSLTEYCRNYNDGVRRALAYEKQGKALVLAPDDCAGMKTLTRNREKMSVLYGKGYKDAEKIKDFTMGD